MKRRRCSLLILLFLPANGLGAPKQDLLEPFPQSIQSAQLRLSSVPLKKLTEVAAGAHVDESLRFIITGHQKGILASTFLFGPLGAIVSSRQNEKGTKERKRLEPLQHNEIVGAVSMEVLSEALGRQAPNFIALEDASAPVLELAPYVLLNMNKTDEVRLSSMMKVALLPNAAAEEPIWQSRFYATTGEFFPKSDLENSKLLERKMRQVFDEIGWGLAKVVQNEFQQYEPVTVTGQMAWMKKSLKYPYPFVIVAATERALLLRTPTKSAGLFVGYHIVNKDSISHEPSSKKIRDPYREAFPESSISNR